jgi:hypothetical protein
MHTIDGARHGQQIFFRDFISHEISSHLSFIHGCLIHTKSTIFPLLSLPFGSCACHLDHVISFDILDIEAPFGDSALKLLFSRIFSALSSLGHAGDSLRGNETIFLFQDPHQLLESMRLLDIELLDSWFDSFPFVRCVPTALSTNSSDLATRKHE